MRLGERRASCLSMLTILGSRAFSPLRLPLPPAPLAGRGAEVENGEDWFMHCNVGSAVAAGVMVRFENLVRSGDDVDVGEDSRETRGRTLKVDAIVERVWYRGTGRGRDWIGVKWLAVHYGSEVWVGVCSASWAFGSVSG